MHGGLSGSNVAGTPTAVAVVDLRTGSTVTNVSPNGVDDCEDWDSGYQREIIDGVTVYYGGDLCDSEDSEERIGRIWRTSLVENMWMIIISICWSTWNRWDFVPGGNPSRFDRRDEYKTYLYDGNDARVPDDDSVVDRERRIWREYCASIFRKGPTLVIGRFGCCVRASFG